jgi:hypothetical protein
MAEIQQQISVIRLALMNGDEFEHGDRSGIQLDNPVSTQHEPQSVRQVKAQRGLLSLPKQPNNFKLVIKQNALFAALANDLSAIYPMVAMVRNPVKVLLSWMTVDLPVNKGRLPAGEKYSKQLRQQLAEEIAQQNNVLHRQIMIYKWFIAQYQRAGLHILKYEDIVSSNGIRLYEAFGIKHTPSAQLSEPARQFPADVINVLGSQLDNLAPQLSSPFYSVKDIRTAFVEVANAAH